MRILDGEIDLRDETRALEQARAAMQEDPYEKKADGLAVKQDKLAERVEVVIQKIQDLPKPEQFGKEVAMLTAVSRVMAGTADSAREILKQPNTGPEAIAAETEAIELLLKTRRMKPNSGGGGGGSTPGGGGSGTTDEAALALIGPGSDRDAKIEERHVRQGTGKSGSELPAEFRDGLDAFLNALENQGSK